MKSILLISIFVSAIVYGLKDEHFRAVTLAVQGITLYEIWVLQSTPTPPKEDETD